MKDIKHIISDFIRPPKSLPKGGTWGVLGVLGGCLGGAWGVLGVKFFNSLNMVMWHIKLKGMISIQGYTEKSYLPLDFFKSVGICDGAPSNVFKCNVTNNFKDVTCHLL